MIANMNAHSFKQAWDEAMVAVRRVCRGGAAALRSGSDSAAVQRAIGGSIAAGLAIALLTLGLAACAPAHPTAGSATAGSSNTHELASGSLARSDRSVPPERQARPRREWRDVGFRTLALFREHYAKHGREFGGITPSEYLAQAQALRDAPAGGNVLELVRDDGVTARFDRGSGTFIAFNRNGTIRTCFKPRDGERYFKRQAMRNGRGR